MAVSEGFRKLPDSSVSRFLRAIPEAILVPLVGFALSPLDGVFQKATKKSMRFLSSL